MPFSAEGLGYAGKLALDDYMKNDPIDQINTDRPLLKTLMAKRKSFNGGKQYIVEQLRYRNDSNFQWFQGDDAVSYNRKRTIEQAEFAWKSAHDGFVLNEDELTQNGITVTDDAKTTPTKYDIIRLTDLIDENAATLKLGFQEKFDFELHLDGTQDAKSIVGLDALIATDPTSGIVGGLDRAQFPWWRNQADIAIPTTDADAFIQRMEVQWRRCTRAGGQKPDFILVGSKFLDAYMVAAKDVINRELTVSGRGGADVDASISGAFFKGIPLIWDPVFEDLQAATAAAIDWEKRCYFINTRYMHLRPAKGHDMVTRKPPRVYNRYAHYWGLTFKGAVTISKPNAMAVMSIA